MPPSDAREPQGSPRSAYAQGANRREFRRMPSSKAAMIRIASGERLPCRVVDISAGGARIEFSSNLSVPDRFKLLIPEDLFEAECEVRHLASDSAGLMFTSNRLEALAAYG